MPCPVLSVRNSIISPLDTVPCLECLPSFIHLVIPFFSRLWSHTFLGILCFHTQDHKTVTISCERPAQRLASQGSISVYRLNVLSSLRSREDSVTCVKGAAMSRRPHYARATCLGSSCFCLSLAMASSGRSSNSASSALTPAPLQSASSQHFCSLCTCCSLLWRFREVGLAFPTSHGGLCYQAQLTKSHPQPLLIYHSHTAWDTGLPIQSPGHTLGG